MELRPAFDALFDLEEALADVVRTSTQPALGAIRLAWWREALERLDRSPPPAEPRLQAIASELLQRGVSGARVAAIEDGFATLLDETPDLDRAGKGGAALFGCAATLLGANDEGLADAGRIFALAMAARRGMAEVPFDRGTRVERRRFPRSVRPLTAFTRLALRDLRQLPVIEPEATPGRAAALLSHRLFGTIA